MLAKSTNVCYTYSEFKNVSLLAPLETLGYFQDQLLSAGAKLVVYHKIYLFFSKTNWFYVCALFLLSEKLRTC